MPVHRIYVEKRAPYNVEAQSLLSELKTLLGVSALTGLRLLCRYDIEGIDETLMRRCLPVVFSEPQVDAVLDSLPEAGRRLRRRIPARAVRPARRLLRRVHPARLHG